MKFLISLTTFIGLFALVRPSLYHKTKHSNNPQASTTPTPLTPPEITIDQIKVPHRNQRPPIHKPSNMSQAGIRCCNQLATGWLDASTSNIQTGINTLKSNGGKCSVGAASCTQLAGNGGSEIVFCNNVRAVPPNFQPLHLDIWPYFLAWILC